MFLAWKAAWLSDAINTYNFIQPQPKPKDQAFCPLVFEDDRVIPPSTRGYSEATNRVESWKESKCKAEFGPHLFTCLPCFPCYQIAWTWHVGCNLIFLLTNTSTCMFSLVKQKRRHTNTTSSISALPCPLTLKDGPAMYSKSVRLASKAWSDVFRRPNVSISCSSLSALWVVEVFNLCSKVCIAFDQHKVVLGFTLSRKLFLKLHPFERQIGKTFKRCGIHAWKISPCKQHLPVLIYWHGVSRNVWSGLCGGILRRSLSWALRVPTSP